MLHAACIQIVKDELIAVIEHPGVFIWDNAVEACVVGGVHIGVIVLCGWR